MSRRFVFASLVLCGVLLSGCGTTRCRTAARPPAAPCCPQPTPIPPPPQPGVQSFSNVPAYPGAPIQ